MELVKIQLDGIQKEVYGLFYIYNSKYYFIYTEKEVDENNYVILYASQVGKETKNTENGPVDTGYLIGVEATTPEEQQNLQNSISFIVEDKKNNTKSSQIQYLPMSTLTNLKIISKKRFRLLKSIMVDNFKLVFEQTVQSNLNEPIVQNTENVITPIPPALAVSVEPLVQQEQTLSQPPQNNVQVLQTEESTLNKSVPTETTLDNTGVIVDYRSKYFEEEEKNKELQAKIEELTQKLNQIKKVIE